MGDKRDTAARTDADQSDMSPRSECSNPCTMKPGWSGVINCTNCAVNSEILARLDASDAHLPSLVEEGRPCGWNSDDSDHLRHAYTAHGLRATTSDTTREKDGSPPITNPKWSRYRRLPPGDKLQNECPFRHYADSHEYMREYRRMSAARWRCQSDKTSEANVLACKTFQWSSYLTNDTFIIASKPFMKTKPKSLYDRKDRRVYTGTNKIYHSHFANDRGMRHKACPAQVASVVRVMPSDSFAEKTLSSCAQDSNLAIWSFMYPTPVPGQNHDKYGMRQSTPEFVVQPVIDKSRPTYQPAHSNAGDGNSGGVTNVESPRGVVRIPSSHAPTKSAGVGDEAPRRRPRPDSTAQGLSNVPCNTLRIEADFNPLYGVQVRTRRIRQRERSHLHSKPRALSTACITTAASGVGLPAMPVTPIADIRQLYGGYVAMQSLGAKDRKHPSPRHAQTCVLPRLSMHGNTSTTQAGYSSVSDVRNAQYMARDDIMKAFSLREAMMTSEYPVMPYSAMPLRVRPH